MILFSLYISIISKDGCNLNKMDVFSQTFSDLSSHSFLKKDKLINLAEIVFQFIFYSAFGLAFYFMICYNLWIYILYNARQFTSCYYISVTFKKYVTSILFNWEN